MVEKIKSLETRLNQVEDLLKSAKPIRAIYNKGLGMFCEHYYSTDEKSINHHINDLKFTDNGNIGFAIMKDPKQIIKDGK